MPKFNYVAMDSRGKETKGTLDVANQNEAISRLKEMGYFPTKVTEAEKPKEKSDKKAKAAAPAKGGKAKKGFNIAIPGFGGKVKPKVLTTFTRQLATLVDAGLPLLRGLRVLEKQERSPVLKRIIGELAISIEGGSTFSEGLAQHPKVFNRLFVNMVKAGELGGVLEVVLMFKVSSRHSHSSFRNGLALISKVLALLVLPLILQVGAATNSPPGVLYTNIVDPRGPWSIHAIRVPRQGAFEVSSVHADGKALGLSELSIQARSLAAENTRIVGAINGDFYQRHGAHAGDPRGLQIVKGELISAPAETASFWIDAKGEPHAANTVSNLKAVWPDGTEVPIGLNGNREPDEVVLYTPAVGRSTRTERGRDVTLEAEGSTAWLPLRPGGTYKAKVRAVRDGANSEVAADTMVLSIGPVLARQLPRLTPGAVLTISTGTSPELRGAKTALSGGPIIVQNSRAVAGSSWGNWFGGDDFSSQSRRHPRSAVGWSGDYYWLVEVDGRQRRSSGMTIAELGKFMVSLGCTDAINLDGGGSATLWYEGRVRNSPCDGDEREIANALVVSTARTEVRP